MKNNGDFNETLSHGSLCHLNTRNKKGIKESTRQAGILITQSYGKTKDIASSTE